MIALFISGGSGSGKSFISNKIKSRFKNSKVIKLDSYYIKKTFEDFSELELYGSIDLNLFRNSIQTLRDSTSIEIPIYSYKLHRRINLKRKINVDVKILIFEGLYAIKLLEEVNNIIPIPYYSIFIKTPINLMLKRRIIRDVSRTGQEKDEIIQQFKNFVKPAYIKYIAAQEEMADFVFDSQKDEINEIYDFILSKL